MINIEIDGLHGDGARSIRLSGNAERLFIQFFGPEDINDTKSTLFNLMHGIAETSVAFNKLALKDEPDAYISTNINTGLYLIARFYELLDAFDDTENCGID